MRTVNDVINSHIGYRRSRNRQRRDFIQRVKSVPCADCGASYPPYVMDFDHVSGKKIDKISDMTASSIEKIQAEIAKCEVVCANCHRERTYRRGLTTARK